MEKRKRNRIFDIDVESIGLVDVPAIRNKFLLIKRKGGEEESLEIDAKTLKKGGDTEMADPKVKTEEELEKERKEAEKIEKEKKEKEEAEQKAKEEEAKRKASEKAFDLKKFVSGLKDAVSKVVSGDALSAALKAIDDEVGKIADYGYPSPSSKEEEYKSVIIKMGEELTTLRKEITDRIEASKKAEKADEGKKEVEKAIDDLKTQLTDLKKLIEEKVPIRRAILDEKKGEEELKDREKKRIDATKTLLESDVYKKATPDMQVKMLLSKAFGAEGGQ